MLHTNATVAAFQSAATLPVFLPLNKGRQNRTATPVSGKLKRIWTTFEIGQNTTLKGTTISYFNTNRFHTFEIHHTTKRTDVPAASAAILEDKFELRNRDVAATFHQFTSIPSIHYYPKGNRFFVRITPFSSFFCLSDQMLWGLGFRDYTSVMRTVQLRKNLIGQRRVHGWINDTENTYTIDGSPTPLNLDIADRLTAVNAELPTHVTFIIEKLNQLNVDIDSFDLPSFTSLPDTMPASVQGVVPHLNSLLQKATIILGLVNSPIAVQQSSDLQNSSIIIRNEFSETQKHNATIVLSLGEQIRELLKAPENLYFYMSSLTGYTLMLQSAFDNFLTRFVPITLVPAGGGFINNNSYVSRLGHVGGISLVTNIDNEAQSEEILFYGEDTHLTYKFLDYNLQPIIFPKQFTLHAIFEFSKPSHDMPLPVTFLAPD